VDPQGRSGRAENLVQPGSSVAIPTELPGHHLHSTYYHMINVDHKLKLVLSETFVLLRLSILILLKLLATAVRLLYSSTDC